MDIFSKTVDSVDPINSPNSPLFYCEKCDYKCSHKGDFNKHIRSKIHLIDAKADTVDVKKSQQEVTSQKTVYVCKCGKEYKSNQGLWKHKKQCNQSIQPANALASQDVDDKIAKTLTAILPPIIESINAQNTSNQGLMMTKLAEMFTEAVKNMSNNNTINNNMNNSNNNTNNSNNTNSNNNTFNLQIFLNETCKDALNLSDFIRTITVDCKDIEEFNKKGYVDATCELIIKHLSALDVEKRPIHCTDAKRETVYVKENDKWEKENDKYQKLQFLIDEVQKINLTVLKIWKNKHPGCLTSSSQYTDLYNNMSQELIGGFCHKVSLETKENKIKSKIARYATIDKSQFI